jgi:hypothetical protein
VRRSVLATAAATTLLALALPSSAEDPVEPVPTPPCDAVEGATTVAGEAAQQTVAAPAVPNAVFHDAADTGGLPVESPAQSMVELPFLLDVSGGTPVDATRGAFSWAVDWAGDAGDFDVYLTDAEGSELGSGGSFNPLDGPGEVVGPVTLKHCQVVTLRIENYAGIPATELTVTATRGKLRT